MKMKVDIVRVSAELSDIMMMKLQEQALKINKDRIPFPHGIIKEGRNGDVVYTNEAQLMFNQLSDEFLELMKENKIDDESKY